VKNLVLIGFMGVGKTLIGKMAAESLGMKFVDTDDVIAGRFDMSVSDIFEKLGEQTFRAAEREVIAELGAAESLVIATGGGAVQFDENVANLRRNGVIVCLCARPEVILARTAKDTSRPLLGSREDRMARICDLLERRRPFYAAADVQIDTSNNDCGVTVDSVVRYYREHEQS
jgi:shikimate kinase